jgi:nucleoside-diphosphate-sugar epimerase
VSVVLDDPKAPGAGSVLVFGSGSLGSAVADSLRSAGRSRAREVRIPWESSRRTDAVSRAMTSLPRDTGIAVVWAAGRAGFSTDAETCEEERLAFEDVARSLESVAGSRNAGDVSFHVVSSAGGLYEGLTRVLSDSPPTPRRPYGLLKHAQEARARKMEGRISVSIYRVSSVYGHPRPEHRAGLIGELIRNGVGRKPSAIYGKMDTLRDYVSNEDVGRHIARRISEPNASGSQVEMLVAGRPASVSQVVDLVERVLRRRLIISFVEAWNAQDISFDAALRPMDFRPEPLQTGIARVHYQYLSRL